MSGVVQLRNGASAPQEEVQSTMVSLRVAAERNLAAFCELVALCRDPGHELWGSTGTELRERFGLLDITGRPHQVVRDVVLSAVSGEDAGLTIGSPYAEAGEQS